MDLKKVNIIGTKYVNRFLKDDTGEVFDETTNKEYYESLSLPNAVNPIKEGYTWKVSFSDNLFDTETGNLEDNQYATMPMYIHKLAGQSPVVGIIDPTESTAPMQVNS